MAPHESAVSEPCGSEAWIPALKLARSLPQEEMALELINCPDSQPRLHQHSYVRSGIIFLLTLLMVRPGLPRGRGWVGQPPEPPPSRHPSRRSAS